jgi:hypothetical protein
MGTDMVEVEVEVEVERGEGEMGGSVDELPRADTPMSSNRKSMPRVKVRAGRIVTPSKKRTSTESASESGQPNIQPTNTEGGTYDNII